MSAADRPHPYAGPPELAAAAAERPAIHQLVRSAPELARWLAARPADERDEPCTYVVDTTGLLRVASRHHEHVACASGGPVLAAGEIRFAGDGGAAAPRVTEASNLSTGYCPAPAAWPALARALDAAGIRHPGGWTDAFEFRRCPRCAQTAVLPLADPDPTPHCAVCDTPLPPQGRAAPHP